MGGRGASSGLSDKGIPYGDEYKSIYQSGNIKFVKSTNPSADKVPKETMTRGRVYAFVNDKNQLKSIIYYDKNGKKKMQIDLDHEHTVNGVKAQPHVHKGYEHNEKGNFLPNDRQQKMIDRVLKIWDTELSANVVYSGKTTAKT